MTTSIPAFSIAPGAGERLRVVSDEVRVLVDSKITGGAFTIIEELTPPAGGPPLHRHGREGEFFYVVEGTAKFVLDGVESVHGTGSFLHAPRNSVHTFCNVGAGVLRMIVLCVPGGLEAPFREADALGRAGRATPEELGRLFARHGVELLGPPIGTPPR